MDILFLQLMEGKCFYPKLNKEYLCKQSYKQFQAFFSVEIPWAVKRYKAPLFHHSGRVWSNHGSVLGDIHQPIETAKAVTSIYLSFSLFNKRWVLKSSENRKRKCVLLLKQEWIWHATLQWSFTWHFLSDTLYNKSIGWKHIPRNIKFCWDLLEYDRFNEVSINNRE